MRRKELILDFTSLLDVIMILLFIVIQNMNQETVAASAKNEEALQEVQAQVEMIHNEKEELQERYEQLSDEYEYLKITSDYDVNDNSVYEAAIKRMMEVTLVCESEENIENRSQGVKVSVYINGRETEQQTFAGTTEIQHDWSLDSAERAVLRANQVVKLTKFLSEKLRDESAPMIWFSIQYNYDDDNITYSDLNVIRESIDNLELKFSKSCYMTEVKLY